MSAPERAPLGAALALLVALVSLTGPISPMLMAGTAALLGVLIGLSWSELLELPSRAGTRTVIILVGLAASLVTAFGGERVDPVGGVLMVSALGVLAAFLHQMLRRDRRDLTASLTGTVAGAFVSGLAATWVLAQQQAETGGPTGVVTAVATGLAATLLLNATMLPSTLRFLLSGAAGAALTAAIAVSLAAVSLPMAIVLGLVSAVGSSSAHLLVGSSLVAREPVPSIAVAAVPVATVGVLAHLAMVLVS